MLNHNTTYNASLGCEPNRIFHGRKPYKILDNKPGYNPNSKIVTESDIANAIQGTTAILHDKTKTNITQSYIRYKAYYDRKTNVSPLTTDDYCFVLNPKADTEVSKISFCDNRWVGPYKVDKVLPNNYCIVRRLVTNKTQILHRIRLRKYTPKNDLPDINVIETDWQEDDEIVILQDDLYAICSESNF